MSELQVRLPSTPGDAHRIERELARGGMSRVRLTDACDLGRRAVIRVLPPEMAAGVNAERFPRETKVAAYLQPSHIVPLLTARSAGDRWYSVTSFVAGESMQATLRSPEIGRSASL